MENHSNHNIISNHNSISTTACQEITQIADLMYIIQVTHLPIKYTKQIHSPGLPQFKEIKDDIKTLHSCIFHSSNK